MGIPIGRSYTATVQGSVLKSNRCEKCGAEYVYEIERSATGSGSSLLFLDNDGAEERAATSARDKLYDKLESAVDAVACPSCGWYQRDMARHLKRQSVVIALVLGLPLVAIASWLGYGASDQWVSGLIFIGIALAGEFSWIGWCLIQNPNKEYEEHKGGRPDLASESRGKLKQKIEEEEAARKAQIHKEFHETLRQSMLLVASANREIVDDEVDTVMQIYEEVTGERLSSEGMRAQGELNVGETAELVARLLNLGHQITDEGKAIFIKAALLVAFADGQIDDSECQAIEIIGRSLNVPAAQVKAIARQVTER